MAAILLSVESGKGGHQGRPSECGRGSSYYYFFFSFFSGLSLIVSLIVPRQIMVFVLASQMSKISVALV